MFEPNGRRKIVRLERVARMALYRARLPELFSTSRMPDRGCGPVQRSQTSNVEPALFVERDL